MAANEKSYSGGLNFTGPDQGNNDFVSLFHTILTKISSHNHEGSGTGSQLDGSAAIQANTVDGSVTRLTNDQYLRGRNNAGSADVNIAKVNTSDEIELGANVQDITINDLLICDSINTSTAGWVSNLGLKYDSSVLSITGADGTALSATNPGYVVLQDKTTPGRLKKYTVTADQGFIDDSGASEIVDNTFGTTVSTAWSQDVPFFIYAVGNDDEDTITFMISRLPHASVSPAAANIGAPDDAVADSDNSFFSFDSLDESVYDANPCLCIGSFRMQKSSSDDWTVQTLSSSDGIGKFQEGVEFNMPTLQNGATTGYLKDVTGVEPEFSSQEYVYYIEKNGSVRCHFRVEGDGGTDGTSTGDVTIALPLTANTSSARTVGSGIVFGQNLTATGCIFLVTDSSTNLNMITNSGGSVQNGGFTSGNRWIYGTWTYQTEL